MHRIWHQKTSLLGAALAITSLSLGHYAGFLMNVPLQIVAVAGPPLAAGVTATFLFYVFFSGIIARVFISMMQLLVLPFLAAIDRLERGVGRNMSWPQQRRFVRRHSQTIRWEGNAWRVIQAIVFLALMLGLYLKFTLTWISGIGIVISIASAVASALVRSGFSLQPKPRIFLDKIRTRSARFGRVASAVFATVTATLVIAAFFMGSMRASLLRDQKPDMVVTKDFTGIATVIASSEGALLLFQKQGPELRYIYFTPEFTTSVESKPVFQPLGNR